MFYRVRRHTGRPILKALKLARTDVGLTITELAKRAGVSRDTISNAERGQHSLQAQTLNKIARALGKAPSELLAQEENLDPKAPLRSSLAPSFNDVLADERREDLFEVVRDAVNRQNKQNSQAAARAEESERAQAYFMTHDNEVIVHLLRYPQDELAGAVLELMHRNVQLEGALKRATEGAVQEVSASP